MRAHNWPLALHEYLAAARAREFAYGAFDCALFCAGWVQIATGIDHASGLRGYTSMSDAYRIIARYGSMEAMVTQLLGAEHVHPSHLQRGDIVMILNHPALGGAPEGLGICEGVYSFFPAAKGLLKIPTFAAGCGWKVG